MHVAPSGLPASHVGTAALPVYLPAPSYCVSWTLLCRVFLPTQQLQLSKCITSMFCVLMAQWMAKQTEPLLVAPSHVPRLTQYASQFVLLQAMGS